jgi:hypothetical protein
MDKKLVLIGIGMVVGAGGTMATGALAAPGDLVGTRFAQRVATAAEEAAADTLATAVYGSPALTDVLCMKRGTDGWLLEGKGLTTVVPASGSYAVEGKLDAQGRVVAYDRKPVRAP